MSEKSYYGFLMQFTNNTTPCRSHLVRIFGEELVDECVQKGYIRVCRTNAFGEPVYTITEKGRAERDG